MNGVREIGEKDGKDKKIGVHWLFPASFSPKKPKIAHLPNPPNLLPGKHDQSLSRRDKHSPIVPFSFSIEAHRETTTRLYFLFFMPSPLSVHILYVIIIVYNFFSILSSCALHNFYSFTLFTCLLLCINAITVHFIYCESNDNSIEYDVN